MSVVDDATFRFTVNNVSKLKRRVFSPPFFVRNLQWKMLVGPMEMERYIGVQKSKQFGFYLICDGRSEYRSWSCNAVAELRLLSLRPEIPYFSMVLENVFSSMERGTGYPNYMEWNDVVDPVKGYIKDDAITVEVHITAEEPQDITYRRGMKYTAFESNEKHSAGNLLDSKNKNENKEEPRSNKERKRKKEIENYLTKENGIQHPKNPLNRNHESDEENDDNEDKEEEPTYNTNVSKKEIESCLIKKHGIKQPNNPSDCINRNNEGNEKPDDINIENHLTNSVNDMKKKSKQSDKDAKTEKGILDGKSENNQEIKNRGEINLLLLSETGVGKSTFINSIANYLTYNNFEIAEKEKLRVLIPAKFQIEDKNEKRHEVSIGESDKNEFLNQGESATQDVKSYIFPVGKNHPNIRLIDTPGMGDTRGPDQDIKNCDYILNYIGNLRELHGICCLFKPLNSRNTVYFQYCISEILSRLDKSASKNIVFVFTNTRGANYSSGETYEILKKTVDDIRSKNNVEISLDNNIFCFDNEAFRYLAASQKNVKLSPDYKEKCRESWTRSKKQFWKMLNYIKKIEPHLVQSTNAINEVRRMVNQLAQPLADISELIHDNIDALQKHQEKLDIENMSLEDLRNQMFMPVIDLQVVPLDQPTTACTALKCSEIYKLGDKNKWHYKQRCHEPCYLKNVQADTIDNPALMQCAAMDPQSNFCLMCSCSYRVHMHVYYMTTTFEQRIENSNALRNIDDKEKFLEEVNKLIADMVIRKDELIQEHDTIVTSCAKFTHFLQNNAIAPFNDSYKDYIEYLLTREQALGPKMSNKQSVVHLRNLLQKYEETKKLFDDSLKMSKGSGTVPGVTSKEIVETVEKLYGLKHSGKKIKELYESQQSSRKREHEYTEYILSPGPRNTRTKCNNAKRGGYFGDNEEPYDMKKREGFFRRILENFFGFGTWGTSKSKGKNEPDFRYGNNQTLRNVKKIHGAGVPWSEDICFGSRNPFYSNQNASGLGDSRNDAFFKFLSDLYDFTNNFESYYPNQNIRSRCCCHQTERHNDAKRYDDNHTGFSSYPQDSGQQHLGQHSYDQNDSDFSKFTRPSNQFSSSRDYHEASNFHNGRHHNYPLNASDHNKLTGPSNLYDLSRDPMSKLNSGRHHNHQYSSSRSDSSRDYHESSNLNDGRQHSYPPREKYCSKGTRSSNEYSLSRDYHEASSFNDGRQRNYPQEKNDYSKVTAAAEPSNPNFSTRDHHEASNSNDGRQRNYPQGDNDYSEVIGPSNQNFFSRDYQEASNTNGGMQHNYPQGDNEYSKVTGSSNQNFSSRAYQGVSNFNDQRQHNDPQEENDYSKITGVIGPSNPNFSSRDHHEAPNFNDGRQRNYTQEDNDYSKVTGCSNQNFSSRDLQEASTINEGRQHKYPQGDNDCRKVTGPANQNFSKDNVTIITIAKLPGFQENSFLQETIIIIIIITFIHIFIYKYLEIEI